MVALGQHRGDLDGHGAIMEVIYGGGGTLLSAVRPCGMDVTSRSLEHVWKFALNHLLSTKGEQGDLEDESRAWIGDTRG